MFHLFELVDQLNDTLGLDVSLIWIGRSVKWHFGL